MNMMKHIQTWLLITLLALSANGAVSAKVASGGINLSNEVHQGLNDSKSLNALGISDVSTIYALSSSISPDAGGLPVITGKHGQLRKDPAPGQSHHLNQDAAFRDSIPTNEAAAVKLEGNAFKDVDSPHFKAHQSLEKFWNRYRRGGDLEGQVPSNLDYTKALNQSLRDAGFNKSQAKELTGQAIKDRVQYGELGGQPVPRLPGRINQKKPSAETE